MSKPRLPEPRLIAIVDDDPGVRGSIASLLRSAGLASELFGDGSDLLDRGRLNDFACIVSDLHMPGVDGKALQEAMAQHGWRGAFIIITAFPTEAAREQILSRGGHAFLIKPIEPDGFLDVVEAAVR